MIPMRESAAHCRWRHDGRPDRYYNVDVFNVDPDTGTRTNIRSATFTSHTNAELWLVAHLTTTRPFGHGHTYRVNELNSVDLGHGHIGTDIAIREPDGWCNLDNAATHLDRHGHWLPRHCPHDLDID